MPNWCENNLEVTGPNESLDKFRKVSRGKYSEEGKLYDLIMDSTVPMPNHIYQDSLGEKERELYGRDNWYDWSIENWGTKWDINGKLIHKDKECLQYEFDSAWSPPIEWLKKVSKVFPDLYFELEYSEPNMDFAGTAQAHDGELEDKEY